MFHSLMPEVLQNPKRKVRTQKCIIPVILSQAAPKTASAFFSNPSKKSLIFLKFVKFALKSAKKKFSI